MADKMMRVAGRGEDGTAKPLQTNKEGNLKVQVDGGFSRRVVHRDYTSSSLFHGFGETVYSGGNAADSRSKFKPFKCGDLDSVIIKIQNNSAADLASAPRILLYNTSESGVLPEFEYELPLLKGNASILVRLSDNILDLDGVLISLPKLSSLGVGYRQVTTVGLNISVSIWGGNN